MKIVFILLSLFLVNCNKGATPASSNQDQQYFIGVGFNSICCGPPSDQFLKDFIKEFNSINNVKITGDKIAGCGREGEFVVLFGLSKMKEAMKKKFIGEIETLIPLQESENKKANTSSGGLVVLHNVKGSDYNHCRIKPQNWEY